MAYKVEYDPDRHCGARTAAETPCVHPKGWGTTHPGEGRCKRHGGATPTRKALADMSSSVRSNISQETFNERLERSLHDPDLLSLDMPVAWLKTTLEGFQEVINNGGVISTDDKGNETKLTPADPQVLEVLKLLTSVSAQAFNMRFNKRFAVSLQELNAIMGQIVNAFGEVAVRYGIPTAAKAEFADKLKTIRINKGPDVQLERAGTGPEDRQSPELLIG